MARAYLLELGVTPYEEAWVLQRALAESVKEGAVPDTVVFLEHEPVITLGRRTDESAEVHLPEGVEIEIVETNRGGKSTTGRDSSSATRFSTSSAMVTTSSATSATSSGRSSPRPRPSGWRRRRSKG
jgi:hypothetical protein